MKASILLWLRKRGWYHGPIHYRVKAKTGRFKSALYALK